MVSCVVPKGVIVNPMPSGSHLGVVESVDEHEGVSISGFIPRVPLSSLENSGRGVAVVQVTLWRLLRLPCWGIVMLGMVCSVTIVTSCCHAQIWSPLLGKRLACVNL
jgi:hypothetical protein